MERLEPKRPIERSNKYAICSLISAISAWIFLIVLLWEYATFAATILAIVLSIIALCKKQNKFFAIAGGIIALLLFIGLIYPVILF